MQQETSADLGIRGVKLDPRTRGQHHRLIDLLNGYPVINVLDGFTEDRLGVGHAIEADTSRGDQIPQVGLIERPPMTIIQHMQKRLSDLWSRGRSRSPFLRSLFPIQHVCARCFMFTGAHQSQFDLVLHIFDMEGPTSGLVADQRSNDATGQLLNQLANPGTGCTLPARDRQKGLGHRDGNFGRLEWNHGPVTADHAEVSNPCCLP